MNPIDYQLMLDEFERDAQVASDGELVEVTCQPEEYSDEWVAACLKEAADRIRRFIEQGAKNE